MTRRDGSGLGRSLRYLALALASMAAGTLGLLVVLELALRLLPVNEGLRAQPVTAETPIFRFAADRRATWSEGWNFAIVNRVRTNNAGFVNDQDYAMEGPRPLIAVVGDNHIEAAVVPYVETLHGRLAEGLGDTGRVYSFAASGAGLPQYLVWADHARQVYAPDGYAFLIIANDFSESLVWHGTRPGFHHFDRLDDGSAALRRIPYQPSRARLMLRQSALAMYLMANLKAPSLLDVALHDLGENDRHRVGNVAAMASEEQLADYRWAVDRFLDRLPAATGVAPERILILTDAIRPEIYEAGAVDAVDAVAASAWAEMRRYLLAEAAARGFATLDLLPVFAARFAEDGRRFEFPTDSHWNGHGHTVAAEAVATSPWLARLRGLDGVAAPP